MDAMYNSMLAYSLNVIRLSQKAINNINMEFVKIMTKSLCIPSPRGKINIAGHRLWRRPADGGWGLFKSRNF
jgi:hypothetical protein